MKLFVLILFLIPNIVFAGPMKMIGEKGKSSEITRTMTIKMYDNYFEPAEINVKKDETINDGFTPGPMLLEYFGRSKGITQVIRPSIKSKSDIQTAPVTPALQPRTSVLPVDKVVDKLCTLIVSDNLIKWRNSSSF